MFKLGRLFGAKSSDSSKLGIEERGGKLSVAVADHEAISLEVTVCNAFSLLGNGVHEGTRETRGDNDVLIWVLVVDKLGHLAGNWSDRAMGVHNVGGLSQTNVGKVELGGVLGQPDLVGVQDGEGAANHVSESTFAVVVEISDEAIDDSEEHGLVEGSVVADEGLGLLWGHVTLLQFLGSLSSLGHVWLSHGSVLGGLSVESVDIHTFL